MSDIDNAVKRLLETGLKIGQAVSIPGGNSLYAVIPSDCKIESLERFVFNEHAERPERVKQTVSVLDGESFIEYYRKFSGENSRVFADETKASVECVLDFHAALQGGDGAPAWGSHRLKLTLLHSPEWKIWNEHNNKQMTQQQFAEFLEQNSLDVTIPSPGAMMDVARDLVATTECDFGSGLRMQDGQVRFKYTETVKAQVGGGQVEVPEKFRITIPVFVGGSPVDMDALLRFRTREGKLTFFYTLVRPESVIRSAFIGVRDTISSELGIVIINGEPR